MSRAGFAFALAVSGMCFVAYPALRPFSDEKSLAGAHAFASVRWTAAHSIGIFAFILLAVGLVGVYEELSAAAAGSRARIGLLLAWIGIGLTLPYYGAEVFGLHAAGEQALRTRDTASFDTLVHDIRWQAGIWFIVAGLLLLAAGTIVFAVAVWRAESLVRWSAIPLAVMITLFLPQFAAGKPIRVAYGVLLACSCITLAWAMTRVTTSAPPHDSEAVGTRRFP